MKKSSALFINILLTGALLIPVIGHAASAKTAAKESTPATSVMATEQKENKDPQISLNQATAEQLAEVMDGIGLKKAQSIINYREKRGPFSSVEQLKDVPGISTTIMERNLSRLKL